MLHLTQVLGGLSADLPSEEPRGFMYTDSWSCLVDINEVIGTDHIPFLGVSLQMAGESHHTLFQATYRTLYHVMFRSSTFWSPPLDICQRDSVSFRCGA